MHHDGEMTFEEIGERLGMTHQAASKICRGALRKLARDPIAMGILKRSPDAVIMKTLREFAREPESMAQLLDLAEYHFALRARSIECQQ